MTTYNRATLKTFFETGDVPTGTDYANLIDSCANIVDTGTQTFGGALNPTELVTARVSAGNVNILSTLVVAGQTSAAGITATIVSADTGTIDNLSVSASTSANNMWVAGNIIRPVVTIAASGTTLGGANILQGQINRLTAVTDGTATGVGLKSNLTGLVQYLYNETATSANLWPCAGGQINVLASGAAFALAGSTLYTIVHTKASGYAVK